MRLFSSSRKAKTIWVWLDVYPIASPLSKTLISVCKRKAKPAWRLLSHCLKIASSNRGKVRVACPSPPPLTRPLLVGGFFMTNCLRCALTLRAEPSIRREAGPVCAKWLLRQVGWTGRVPKVSVNRTTPCALHSRRCPAVKRAGPL